MLRFASLALFFALWQAGSVVAGARKLPSPSAVFARLMEEAQSGALFLHLGTTLGRVTLSFVLALLIGAAIGYAMGRNKTVDRFGDPWLVLFLNLPALVIIVLAYIWVGLNEVAAIGAVALNKIPNAAATIREGARALDPGLDEMAAVFRFPALKRLRHVTMPQLAPYVAAAARSGLSLVWKIVLVVEMLGRSNGVGFQINVAFQNFDLTLLLAYAVPFVVVMLAIETFAVQPIERRFSSWRTRSA